MSKLLPVESVPNLGRPKFDDPLFQGWLEKIARTTEQQSRLLRRTPTGTSYQQAEASGLVVNVASVSSITVTSDDIWVKDIDNNPEVLTSTNTTVALADVLDSGSVAINTWYYLFLIYNGTTSRILASTSLTALTMPTGYNHKGLLTAVRTTGAGALPLSYTQGRRTEITEVTVLNAGTSAVAAAVSVASAAPPNGRFVSGWAFVDATVAGARGLVISLDGTRGNQRLQTNDVATGSFLGNWRTAYAASQITYLVLGANNRGTIIVTGWEF